MRKGFIICTVALFLYACEGTVQQHTPEKNPSDTANVIINDSTALSNTTVELIPLTNSPEFADAILELNAPDNESIINSNEISFNYNIKNYQLGKPTTDGSCAVNCANSDKGQHIHLILNNQPYLAKYESSFIENLEDGHYVALSFLSRSYHESIKEFGASDLRQFTVGKAKSQKVDLTEPMLFYSRPKGEYKGKDTENVLLDFFLVNTNLSEKGIKVRATINGKPFLIDDWRGYIMKGLPLGETTIKLELVDSSLKRIPGLYNSVERKIFLKR
jgi:hypothetical protein